MDVLLRDTASVNKVSSDIALVLADLDLDLISIASERQRGLIHVTLDVDSYETLARFINRVESKPGVSKVYRA